MLDFKATKTQQSSVPCRKEFIDQATALYPLEGSLATVNEAKVLVSLWGMAECKRRIKGIRWETFRVRPDDWLRYRRAIRRCDHRSPPAAEV